MYVCVTYCLAILRLWNRSLVNIDFHTNWVNTSNERGGWRLAAQSRRAVPALTKRWRSTARRGYGVARRGTAPKMYNIFHFLGDVTELCRAAQPATLIPSKYHLYLCKIRIHCYGLAWNVCSNFAFEKYAIWIWNNKLDCGMSTVDRYYAFIHKHNKYHFRHINYSNNSMNQRKNIIWLGLRIGKLRE